MSDEEEAKPGATCPKCGHVFQIGMADMFKELTGAMDPDNAFIQGYHEAVQYWFMRLVFVGMVLGGILGFLLGAWLY